MTHSIYSYIAENIDVLEKNECLNIIEQLISDVDNAHIISFVNAHAANLAYRDSSFRHCLVASRLLLRDGLGVEILMKRLGKKPGPNLNGTDLIPTLLYSANTHKRRVAIFGTNIETIQKVEKQMVSSGLNIVSSHHGFDKPERYLELCKEHKPELVILGMGMPIQEHLAIYLTSNLSSGVVVNGGAIFDFMSGRVKRGPQLFRKLKLEWLFRLFLEPKRLFKRYVVGNILFLWRCI